MSTECFVSLEIAKLLNENGFKEKTDYIFFYYEEDGGWCFEKLLPEDKFDEKKMLRCPTHQSVMSWFRKNHHIHILPWISDPSQLNPKYYCVIWDTSKTESHIIELFNSYEEACEESIKYCLENMI